MATQMRSQKLRSKFSKMLAASVNIFIHNIHQADDVVSCDCSVVNTVMCDVSRAGLVCAVSYSHSSCGVLLTLSIILNQYYIPLGTIILNQADKHKSIVLSKSVFWHINLHFLHY